MCWQTDLKEDCQFYIFIKIIWGEKKEYLRMCFISEFPPALGTYGWFLFLWYFANLRDDKWYLILTCEIHFFFISHLFLKDVFPMAFDRFSLGLPVSFMHL